MKLLGRLLLVGLGFLMGVLIVASRAQVEDFRKAVEPTKRWHAEAGYGKCRGSSPDEGTWQQRELAHKVQLSDNCGEAGLAYELNHDLSLGARYVNFGQFASYAVANNDPQDKANLRGSVSNDHTRAECQQQGSTHPLREDCYYRWNGSGRIDAMLFSVGWHPIHFGELKIGGELGLAVYKATWRMVIQPMASNDWQYQYDQRTGWQRAPELGISAKYKYLYAAYRVYMIPDGAPITPAYRSPVTQFVVGVSIPL